MKKGLRIFTALFTPALTLPLILLMQVNCGYAQVIDETFEASAWQTAPASAGNSGTTSGQVSFTNTNSTVTYFTVQNSSLTSTRINTTPNPGAWWYSKAQTTSDTKMNRAHSVSHGMQISSSGYIITPATPTAFVSVTFWAALAGPMYVGINTNTNAPQPSYSSGSLTGGAGFDYASQTFSSVGNSSMTSYLYTGSFSGPARIGFFNTQGSSIYIDDIAVIQPTGTPPTVATVSITPGQNVATINGSVTPGTMPLGYSGVIWSTNNAPMDTSVATKTKNSPSATGPFSNVATGLTPGTSYFGRAYVVDAIGNVYYGLIIPFQTLSATAPTLTTVPVFNIQPYKANSGGSNIDSGGLAITQKGICWSTSPNPTTASSRTTDGPNGNNYTSVLRVLQPSTTYYVRAYAVNTSGTGYGNEVSFVTAAPAPALIATPLSLNFGSVSNGSGAPVLNFSLTGYNLTPAAGTITITTPAGYLLSTSASTGFTTPLTIPYTSGGLSATRIYVQFPTTSYGTFSGFITSGGGGVAPQNADSVAVTGAIIPNPSVTTNLGTDFWTGFGYQEKMDQRAGNSAEAKLSIYVSVPSGSQAATVNVELPGVAGATGFPKQNLSVAAGTVIEIKDFPTGDAANEFNPSGRPDSRLYATGFTNRGIHVYSTNGVPISVWMHSYTQNNSAAGAMLFPTNTWNNAYTVQAYGGYSNSSNPASFFFVIANENNTPIWFTPANDIVDSSAASIFNDGHTTSMVKYKKGIKYGPFTLNAGQIFNAMGFIQGSGTGVSSSNAFGLDLSGSTVETTCDKKIAVFGGNGRCLINATGCTANSGSDHMIQQMFPKVAWGTKYITVPTKTMEHNLFRINVSDPTTNVWINNPTHTTPAVGLINNLYYQFQTGVAALIESDKPINVTQLIVAGQCATQLGDKGVGDPEMIILSPVQQAINNATVYSAGIKNSGATYNGHYINVVIRKGGISSFRLDGAAVADTGINQATANAGTIYNGSGTIPIANAFVKLPYDTNYYTAKFKVAPLAAHRISSDSIFNAIAYGLGDGESYGYSAGTNIKDLSKPLLIDNPYSINATNTTCKNNPIRLRAVLPYAPAQVTSITWYMGQITGLNRPDTTINNPVPDSTYIVDGLTYYVYTNPGAYIFPTAGTFRITGLVSGTFASACGSTTPLDFTITVGEGVVPDFTTVYNGCVSDTVKYTDASNGLGFSITKWEWQFGDGKTDTLQNPSHVYSPTGIYNIKLRAVNSIGCYADTVKVIDQTSTLIAKFGVRDTICAGSLVTFTDSSTSTSPIVKWYWNYGDGVKDTVTNSTPRTHTYNTAGPFTVTLTVETGAGCKTTTTKTINIRLVPFASFNMPAGICLPSGLTQFTNLSTISDNTPLTYGWNFGDLGTSTVKDPLHTYSTTGPFTIKLTTTSQYGCVKDTSRVLSTVYAQPTAGITVAAENCLRDTTVFTDNSNGQGQAVVKWYWNFGDGKTDTVKSPKHVYALAGTYTIKLVVTTDKGCVSDTITATVVVNSLPVANFSISTLTCAQQAITFTDQSTSATGTTLNSWNWNMGNTVTHNFTNNNPFTETYTTAGNYSVYLIVTNSKGCKSDTAKKPLVIHPLPSVGFTTPTVCFGDAFTQFTDTSTIADGTQSQFTYSWNFGDANATPLNPNTNTTKNPRHTYTVAGDYVVTMTVTSVNSCVSTTTKTITVHPLPFANFSLPAGICLPSGKAQFSDISTIADGSQSQFTYTWNFGDPNNSTGSTIKNPIHFYSSNGPFGIKLSVKSKDGCSKDTTKILSTVFPQPKALFTPAPLEVCLGQSIKFTDNSTGITSPVVAWLYDYKDGFTDTVANPTHTYQSAGNYDVTLRIVNRDGCPSDTAKRSVIVHAYPVVDAGPDINIIEGDSTMLFPSITGNVLSYLWTSNQFFTYLDSDTIENPISRPAVDVTYRLQVTGTGGCMSEDFVSVKLLKQVLIPNAFSPNRDNINDTWAITYLDTYPGSKLEVFNRYGQPVFSSKGSEKAWDGTSNGKPLPVGTYYYVIDLNNAKRKLLTGWVVILR
jgi:gliding motility-associated-like protein